MREGWQRLPVTTVARPRVRSAVNNDMLQRMTPGTFSSATKTTQTAGWLLFGAILLSVASGLGLGVARALPGAAFWLAGVLLVRRVSGLQRTQTLAAELSSVMSEKGVPHCINTMASIFTLFFTDAPVTDFASASRADGERYAAFYRHLRSRGVNLAPSGYECAFTSFAHTGEDFDRFLEAARSAEL